MTARREVDDDRGSRRGRDDDRSERRGRDDDSGDRRRGRDDDDRSSRGRDRDDDRGSRRREDDDDRRGGSSRRSSYEYQGRSAESVKQRAARGNKDFDKFLKDHIKMFRPNDGDNRIRILPPTWSGKQEHYGLDIWVHYGVGADRQSYLDLFKMKDEADPIHEEYERFKRAMDPEDKKDQEAAKELESKRRVLIFLVDRDNEKDGVQAWAMPASFDRDIVSISVDKSSGEVLPIDHPEEGYDVEFTKKGAGMRTEYGGVSIARRSSPLGKSAWLEYAQENPLDEQLVYFDYDHIAKVFGGGGARRDDRGGSRDHDDDRGRGKDRDDDRRGGRDDDRGSRDRDRGDDRGRGGREERGGSRDRNEDARDALTYESVHEMRQRELEDLIEDKKLDINPREAKDTEDLAAWICEELELKKSESSGRRRVTDDGDEDRLRKMRERRD